MANAVYVHIPFCKHICHYCDFNKVYLQNQPIAQYVNALDKEMELTVNKFPPKPIRTIYVGGGTPTALPANLLEKVMKSISFHFPNEHKAIEWTVEVNPGEVEDELFFSLMESGVNRLSIGVQSFETDLLKAIGRTHTEEDVYETIEKARKAGFVNLSLDLMFGLPGQSLEHFNNTLEKALQLQVEHFSAYSLKIEEKTIFYNLQRRGKLHLPPEEDEVAMYELLMEKMEQHGYHQYEISNFALTGKESKHNITYWDNNEYYGIGAGAHGYVEGTRYVNAGPVPHYLSKLDKNTLPIMEKHHVSEVEKIEEEMFMGLRKRSGISKNRFRERFGRDVEEIYGEQLEKLSKKGLLLIKDDSIKLSKKALFVANEVFEQFLC